MGIKLAGKRISEKSSGGNPYAALVDERIVPLTLTEYTVLRVLLQYRGKIVPPDFLHSYLPGAEDEAEEGAGVNAIRTTITRLRKKLDATQPEKYVRTRRAVGYYIEEEDADA